MIKTAREAVQELTWAADIDRKINWASLARDGIIATMYTHNVNELLYFVKL